MDLVVTTSPIVQQDFIDKAIKSVSHIHFLKKFIVCDGLPQSANALINQKYSIYKERLKREYPDFTIIESQSHRWFIGSIRDIINKSAASRAKWIFCIQHDVTAPKQCDPYRVLDNRPDDAKILFYNHKPLIKPTHWFPLVEDSGDFIKTFGWSERIFLFDKEHMKGILENYNHPKFIEFIAYNQTKRKNADNQEYWKIWRSYAVVDEYHTHLVGKTLK
jgi:hypothetical protein